MGGSSGGISTSPTKLEAISLQSSTYGATITLAYGLTRLPGNLIWYGGFNAVPQASAQGGKGGGVKTQSSGYTYTASVMMALCHGQISGIQSVWRGKQLYSGGVTAAQLLTVTETYTPPGSGAMAYTTAHAAGFAAIAFVQCITGIGDQQGIDTLAQGTDYTVSAGVITFFNERYRGLALSITYQYISGGVTQTALDELGLSFIPGAIGQAAWSGLASFGAQSIGYSGLAMVAAQDYDLGTGAQVDNHNFEVVAPLAFHLGSTVPDVDPTLVLRDVLSNSRAGAAFPPAQLDAWSDWSDYCVAAGLLVSPALTDQKSAADVVAMAAQLTNTGPVWSGGRLRMVPYADSSYTGNGRTFTPDSTAVYALDDECWAPDSGNAPVKHTAKSPADCYNHVRVEYCDRSHQYNIAIAEAKDQADIDMFGLRSMSVVQAHWICDSDVARHVAQNMLQRSLHVVDEYEVPLPWHFALLEPMDLLTLTDAGLGLNAEAGRILEIAENDAGDLTVTIEGYPAGVSSAVLYPSQAPVGYKPDYNAAPGNVDTPVLFEAPADLTTTGLAVYVAARGSGAVWGGCQVWVSLDGSNYKLTDTVYGPARYGALSASTLAGASSMAVSGLGAQQLNSGSAADAAALSTLCFVAGANPEYLAYQTATLTGLGAYTLSGLVHGGYGTTSLAHTSGDAFVRVDDSIGKSGDLDLSLIGQTIYVKLCSFNVWGGAQQTLADVSAYTYAVTGVLAALGAAGRAGSPVFIYQRGTSSPALPSATATFTFATGALSGLNNGWSATIPAGTDPIYVSTAAASGLGPTAGIAPSAWATAKILAQNGAAGSNGTNGTNGTNGSNGANGADAIAPSLSLASWVLPSDTAGAVSDYSGAVTVMKVVKGATDDSSNWTFSKTDDTGVTSSISGQTVTVSAMTVNAGRVAVTATRAGYAPQTLYFGLTKSLSAPAPGPTMVAPYIVESTITASPTPCVAGVTVAGDGTVKRKISGTSSTYTAVGNWYLPTTSGIGSSGGYYVRFVKASQVGGTIGGTFGSWLALSSDRTVTLSATSTVGDATIDYQIASDSAGATIVCSGTIEMHAESS